MTLPGEPNNGSESARAVTAQQRAVEREIHAGAQDAGVRVAGLTEVGEYEATFAGSKDAPVDIGERVTVTVRVGEDGSLLPRRANSDTSTPAATSILQIEVTPSVEFDSGGDSHVVWNGYASQADVATGRIIASSLSGPTTDQQEALQGGRSASEYGKDGAYKDGMLQHMARSRAEAVTQALSPLVSGGKMNLGRLEPIVAAESEAVQDSDTPTQAPEPETAEPTKTAEAAVVPRIDFGKWVKRGAVMVAAAGVTIGGAFVIIDGDAPPTEVAAVDGSLASATSDAGEGATSGPNQQATASPELAKCTVGAEAAPPADLAAIKAVEGDAAARARLGAQVTGAWWRPGSHIFTMSVAGDGETVSADPQTKWYNPRFVVNHDENNLPDPTGAFTVDVGWNPDGTPDIDVLDENFSFIPGTEGSLVWLDQSTLEVTVSSPEIDSIEVKIMRIELVSRVGDKDGRTLASPEGNGCWTPN